MPVLNLSSQTVKTAGQIEKVKLRRSRDAGLATSTEPGPRARPDDSDMRLGKMTQSRAQAAATRGRDAAHRSRCHDRCPSRYLRVGGLAARPRCTSSWRRSYSDAGSASASRTTVGLEYDSDADGTGRAEDRGSDSAPPTPNTAALHCQVSRSSRRAALRKGLMVRIYIYIYIYIYI